MAKIVPLKSLLARLLSVVMLASSTVFIPLGFPAQPAAATAPEEDKVLVLDGNGDYLSTGEDLFPDATPSALTISLWMKLNSPVSGNDTILRHGSNAISRTTLYIDDGEVVFLPFGLSTRITWDFHPQVGAWHHYTLDS